MAAEDDAPEGGIEPTLVVADRTIAGKYKLGRLIGEGGMGAVYEAEHIGLGAPVAVKLLAESFAEDQTFVRRFRREARAAAAVRHPNVVTVTDTGTDEEGVPFLVMELLDGESLSSVVRRQGALPGESAADIVAQVLAGLATAHRKGVVHRDLKLANVFLAIEPDGSQRVKILDFGISKFAAEATSVTAAGAIVGTPSYMAPEQVRGRPDIDARADLYAVGVMLYRMCTGKLPFAGQKARQIYDRILRGQPIPPTTVRPTIPEPLARVIVKGMAFERVDRYQTAGEFIEALREAVPGMEHTDPLPVLSRTGASVAPPPTDHDPRRYHGRHEDTGTAPTREAKGMQARRAQVTATRALGVGRSMARRWRFAAAAAVVAVAVAASVASMNITGIEPEPGTVAAGDNDGAPMADAPLIYRVARYADPAEIHGTHDPLVAYLQQVLGRPAQLQIMEYLAVGEDLQGPHPRLVALSAAVYVKTKSRHPDLRLLATAVNPGGSSYQGQILTRAESGLTRLADLRGKRFCFVHQNSSSGYLYPAALLRQAGIDPETDLTIQYAGTHPNALALLDAGHCDAAAVYQSAVAESGLAIQRFSVLASTARIPYDAYCVSGSVPEAQAAEIRRALLALTPGGLRASEVFSSPDAQLRGFVAAEDSDYDVVRQIGLFLERPTD